MTGSFLEEPPVSAQMQALYDEDLADDGYVWNGSRLWAHQLFAITAFVALRLAFSTINDALGAQPARGRWSWWSARWRTERVEAVGDEVGDWHRARHPG
jgi:hypothetical protein